MVMRRSMHSDETLADRTIPRTLADRPDLVSGGLAAAAGLLMLKPYFAFVFISFEVPFAL